MTDTASINQPQKRPMADDRLANILLLSGLVIVPTCLGLFGFLYGDPAKLQSIWAGCLLLAFLAIGFCSCVASAFFTSCSLLRRFLLALIAVGLFAFDFCISCFLAVWIFDFD